MEKVGIENIRQILKELITELLENKIDRKTAAKLVRKKVELVYVLECNDKSISYSYFALNGLDDADCNTTNSELLYLKYCLEGKREYSDEDKAEFVLNSKEPICKLIPSLKGQELDFDDYERYTPEKFEYFDGYIFGNKITASKLLALLMTNLGIETVIKLAPREVWLKALELDAKK